MYSAICSARSSSAVESKHVRAHDQRAHSGKFPPIGTRWSCDPSGPGSEKKMAAVGEEKGWTFDAFDSGTLRESASHIRQSECNKHPTVILCQI